MPDADTSMGLFQLVAGKGSLSAAARELGISTSAVSKRLARLEQRLGVRLLHRTTRRLKLTDEGELYLQGASRILAEIGELERSVGSRRVTPRGLIRVNATFGFGRRHVAPALLEYARLYPEVQVQLDLSDRPLNLVEEGYDIGIRVGAPGDTALVARKLAPNHRVVCGAPSYLRARGTPRAPRELAAHDCLILRQDGADYALWRFTSGGVTETVRVRGTLASNDGEVVRDWAVSGHGLILRSWWDVADEVARGRLVTVLDGYRTPEANVHAVYPVPRNLPAKVRLLVDFLAEFLAARAQGWSADRPRPRPGRRRGR
ncbi:MAG TPA: LysR family transcriptional regulator [Anaeromyxobacteraceae bacterium]|nr:LysR family transcriptional regulator [Anaeromyxobacteraceae bacterium]